MGTTTLLTLQARLQSAMGDDRGVYTDKYLDAINSAIRQIYPNLARKVDNTELITGNILPPFNWTSTTALQFYTSPSGTLTKTTTAGKTRNGETSAYVLASGADDGIVLDSNSYPRLLDLMDKQITLKCWAYPQTADDAFLDIITTDNAGTDTTKSSTTACPAGAFTLLEIEDYEIPDDIVRIRIKLRVHTTAKYVYFDLPRLTGRDIREYLLPYDFQNGNVRQVYIQSTSYSDDACDDLHPLFYEQPEWAVVTDGVYKYLKLPPLSGERRIGLIGDCPLETLSSGTDPISLDGEKIDLLIAYAAYLLYEMKMGTVSALDVSRYERLTAYWFAKYQRLLSQHAQGIPPSTFKIGYDD